VKGPLRSSTDSIWPCRFLRARLAFQSRPTRRDPFLTACAPRSGRFFQSERGAERAIGTILGGQFALGLSRYS